MSNKVVIRNSIFGMMKHGRFRALRNLPVGWVTQSIHSTDATERNVRVLVELAMIVASIAIAVGFGMPINFINVIAVAVAVHTVTWLLFGNFWVYMLDSFSWVGNGGIDNVLKYTLQVQKTHMKQDVCDAVLIYGSMSREMFHDRSDLDLRVIRRIDSKLGYVAILYALKLKTYAFFAGMPVDYQVVDSLEFLNKQMRSDEKPIVVYVRDGITINNEGLSLDEVIKNPSLVLKPK